MRGWGATTWWCCCAWAALSGAGALDNGLGTTPALGWSCCGAMKSRTGREVLVSLGIAVCAGDEVGHCSYGDGGIHSEQDLEAFLGLASQWLGLHENRNGVRPCVSHFGGWCPFKSWAVFKGDNCKAAMLSRFTALPVSLTQTVSPFQTTT